MGTAQRAFRWLRTQIRIANSGTLDEWPAWMSWLGLVFGLLIAVTRAAGLPDGPRGWITADLGPAAQWAEHLCYLFVGCFMTLTNGEALLHRARRRRGSAERSERGAP
ncbi:hypothetical protein AB0L05_33260 [Nonomuraea pusilla]|uniref:hypothetical protein n=1 Tax=Nonomuraea pusilla TaxID=46177 RepID=UPI0033303075